MNDICLTMVVRDESKVIKKCLESVKRFISSYCIVIDDRTTDNTKEVIEQTLPDIPGKIITRKYVEQGEQRTYAVSQADGDYALLMDADEEFVGYMTDLKHDAYYVRIHLGELDFAHLKIVRTGLPWIYIGARHPYITKEGGFTYDTLPDCYITSTMGKGARSHGISPKEKYLKDAEELEEICKKEPDSKRWRFYLANSYKDAGENKKAIENYEKRIAMGGWEEEVYMSKFWLALCTYRDTGVFPTELFLEAYNYRPSRLEAIYEVIRHFRLRKMYHVAYAIANSVKETPYPKDNLFINRSVHEWKILDELSVSAYWSGHRDESYVLCGRLLRENKVGDSDIKRVKSNFELMDSRRSC